MIKVVVQAKDVWVDSCAAVDAATDMELIAAIDHGDSLADALAKHQPQAVVDFTIPDCVFSNTKIVISTALTVVGHRFNSRASQNLATIICRKQLAA